MPYYYPIILSVKLANLSTTTTTTRAGQGALYGDDELALLGDLRLQDSDLWDVERNCNVGGRHGFVLSGMTKDATDNSTPSHAH